jgi:large subunit ribosomal protein L27
MGRDHTIFSLIHGYVKYYKDPVNHPKRQFIGVTFDRDDKLPHPPNAARKRRIGMLAVPIPQAATEDVGSGLSYDPEAQAAPARKRVERVKRKNYAIMQTNWEIGRAAERAGVKVAEYVPGDRFKAWRKRNARRARAIEKKQMRTKKSSKKVGRKQAVASS